MTAAGEDGVHEGAGRCLVAHTNELFRAGLAHVVEGTGLTVAGSAADTGALLELLDREPVEVIVCEAALPGGGGLAVLDALLASERLVPIVACVDPDDSSGLPWGFFQAAVSGRLDAEHLRTALAVVRAGGTYVDPALREALKEDHADALAGLTSRELQVLKALAEGRSSREVADELVLSRETVKTHVGNVIRKLGVQSRSEAIAQAFRLGLVHADPDAPARYRVRVQGHYPKYGSVPLCTDLAEISLAVLRYLYKRVGFSLWMVTQSESDDWIIALGGAPSVARAVTPDGGLATDAAVTTQTAQTSTESSTTSAGTTASADASLETSADSTATADATVSADVLLGASTDAAADATVSADASLETSTDSTVTADATVSADASLDANVDSTIAADTTISADASLEASTNAAVDADATVSADASLDASADATVPADASVSADASLDTTVGSTPLVGGGTTADLARDANRARRSPSNSSTTRKTSSKTGLLYRSTRARADREQIEAPASLLVASVSSETSSQQEADRSARGAQQGRVKTPALRVEEAGLLDGGGVLLALLLALPVAALGFIWPGHRKRRQA